MAMTRAQLRRAAIIAKCKAAKDKPLERRRVRSFMEPITNAFASILQGSIEVDENDTPSCSSLSHPGKLQSASGNRRASAAL